MAGAFRIWAAAMKPTFAKGWFAGLLAASAVAITVTYAAPSIASPARTGVVTAGPGSSTINLTIPAACLSSTATHRIYPLNAPQGDNYWRSGEHGHGKLTCIVFMTRTYSKVLVIDQAQGGYTIPVPAGVDVTYVDCVPPLRFPKPPFTGINDCGESWGTGEGAWVFPPGYAGAGTAMIPGATP